MEYTDESEDGAQDVIFGTNNRRLERIGSIAGMCVGSDYNEPGSMHRLASDYCVMAYDIECEFDPHGTIPDRGRIICASVVCNCGYTMTYGTVHCSYGKYYRRLSSSTRVAVAIVTCIQSHMPLFIVGHNVYQYDNRVLAHWIGCDGDYAERMDMDKYFRVIPSTRSSDDNISLLMTIPGTNNIDSLVWFTSTMYTEYRSFGLDNLCKAEGIAGKSVKSRFTVCLSPDEMVTMISYNVRDCEMVIELCSKKLVTGNILYLCNVTGAPFGDVAVYHTGAMGSCALSKAAMKDSTMIVWRRCEKEVVEMKGGYVHFVSPILAKGVLSLDFNSLYPSIMLSTQISPERMVITTATENYTRRRGVECNWLGVMVDWGANIAGGGSCSRFRIAYLCGGQRVEDVVYSDIDPESAVSVAYASVVCRKSIEGRKAAKLAGNGLLAYSLKVCANSLYGSTGNSRSVSYSPLCSMAVAGAGRWLLGVMMVSSKCFEDIVIVYGDTDSIFLSPGNRSIEYARTAVRARSMDIVPEVEDISRYITGVVRSVCLNILSYTPYTDIDLSAVVMDRKSNSIHAVSMAILKPKMYATMSKAGDVSAKGLSVVRRDRTEMQCMIQTVALNNLMRVESQLPDKVMELAMKMHDIGQRAQDQMIGADYKYEKLSSRGRIRLLGDGSGSDDHYWESTRYNGASGDTIRDLAVAGLMVDTGYYNRIATATVREMMSCVCDDPVGVLETARRMNVERYLGKSN